MLFFLLACAPAPTDSANELPPLAEFQVEVGDESGAVYVATASGSAPAAGAGLRIEIVDQGHPGRVQSQDCPTDQPIQGCATLSWGLEQPPTIDFDGVEVFLHPDGTLGASAPDEDGFLALGSSLERFTGAATGIHTGEWTLQLPVVHLLANAPDGQRLPAQIHVVIRED
ncbi:MAG: hypothetical protein KC912_03095 [Proteobacteria bacterium]|nr:hypothetical protein [Pseudomonadota bacterium]